MPEELISSLELDGIRADVEQLFVDECVIYRVTNIGTPDPSSAKMLGRETEEVYAGRCSIYPIEARRDRFDEVGQGLIFTRQYRVALPFDVDNVQQRDIYMTTVSADFQLIGREMEVRDVLVSTNTGYRRLTVHDTRE